MKKPVFVGTVNPVAAVILALVAPAALFVGALEAAVKSEPRKESK